MKHAMPYDLEIVWTGATSALTQSSDTLKIPYR
jgi:hypothetical protein